MVSNLTKKFAGALVLATSLVALGIASPAMAQQATIPIPLDQVLATIDGRDITQLDLTFATEDLAADLVQIPADQRRSFVLSVLIDLRLMAKAARALDLDKSDTFAARQLYLESRSLRRAYLSEVVAKTITEAKVRDAYDASVAEFKPSEQVHARHILVATLDDAQAVLNELATGKPFEDVAREKSTGPSGPTGGDLGFFGRGQMVPPFEEAAFSTEAGAVSEPVQTQFGWHVIKIEEKRETAAPSFEETAPQLRQGLLIEAFNNVIADLKAAADIQVLDDSIQLEIVQ